eukprot:Skav219004  [mRNA]  locus=scaffold169:443099:444302:+ [translate_table: standard]
MPLYLIDTLFHLDWMLGGMRLEQHRIDESDEEWMRIVLSHVECVHRKAAEQRDHVVNFWSSIRETFACCCPPGTDEHDEVLEVSVETDEHDELLEVSDEGAPELETLEAELKTARQRARHAAQERGGPATAQENQRGNK